MEIVHAVARLTNTTQLFSMKFEMGVWNSGDARKPITLANASVGFVRV